MNVLITGGYGFIGSHVAEEFFREGHRIFVIDNLSTGNSKNIKFRHTSYRMDIEDNRCREVFRSNRFDIVVHLAAQINVASSIEDPYRDTSSNILGLTNMLQLSAQYGVRKFVFASSAAIYGNNTDLPLDEADPPDPISPYGMSKATGELYCRKWSQIYGLSTVCFRFSNVYGPRQGVAGEGGVISIFMERAVQGKELVVFGDGGQTRDFIYVKDIAAGIYKAVEKDIEGVYNLSTNTGSSINQLVEVLRGLQPVNGVIYKEERAGDIRDSRLDNTKLREAMDWKPCCCFSEGLERTYSWYLDYYKSKRKGKSNEGTHNKRASVWRSLSSRLQKSGLLYCIENLLLFFMAGFMTITSQNASKEYIIDYKLVYILFTGLIYGTRQAALAAVLSCGLYIFLYIEGGRDVFALVYDTDSLLQLSFYLLAGIVTGYIIDTKNNELKGRNGEIKALNERVDFMNKIHDETLLIKDELCDQIISTQDSYGKVYHMITRLNCQNPKEVLVKGVGVIEDTMKSEAVAIYMLSDSKHHAVLAAKSGRKDFNPPAIFRAREREDLQRVMKTRDIYVNYEWQTSLPVMSAPITDRDNIVAVACVYSVEFENITLYRRNMLKVVVNLISYALSNAYRYREATEAKFIDYMAAAEDGHYFMKSDRIP